jgi:hypothetical protein
MTSATLRLRAPGLLKRAGAALLVLVLGLAPVGMAPAQSRGAAANPAGPAVAPAVDAGGRLTRGANLRVGNVPLRETSENYHRYIKYLTVPPARQASPAFRSLDARAVKALEDPLRRQIFEAMLNNPADQFSFPGLRQAQENFTMRVEAIGFMNLIERGPNGGVDFNYYGARTPAVADPAHWRHLSLPEFVFVTLPGARASDAIDGMVRHKFRGECLGALEVTVLQAGRKAIGASRFDRLHPNGLVVADGKSTAPHVVSASQLSLSAMVPGDWVYMKNKDDYNSDLRPRVRPGPWQGENALYMGRYDPSGASRVYHGGAAPRFSGMGVYGKTEDGMRQALRHGYLELMGSGQHTHRRHAAPADGEMRWTSVARLVTGD